MLAWCAAKFSQSSSATTSWRRPRSARAGAGCSSATCSPTSRRPSSCWRACSSRRSSSPRRRSAFSGSGSSRPPRRGAACCRRAATSCTSRGGSRRSPARRWRSPRSASICSATGSATPWTRSCGSERRPAGSMATSHFFAYLSRMKFIRRWGLMHSTYPENIQEPSLRVAQIAHALAIIRNRLFDGGVDPERTVALALYHDTSEVLTGDLPSPVKAFNPEIKRAYHAIEAASREQLLRMIPDALRPDYEPYFRPREADRGHRELVKAADKLCAYLKCLEEVAAGNPEFAQAEKALRAGMEQIDLPEVRYFLETFVPSFKLTLDELH